jgi:SNF family Na+-dependent transporter
MKSKNRNWTTLTYGSTFLLGVILFWSFGKDWLNLEATLVFLAGLIGVAVSVLGFVLWSLRNNSHPKEN